MQTLVQALDAHVAAHAGPNAASPTAMEGVEVICVTQPHLPFRNLYRPSLCLVAQGAKQLEVEENRFEYRAGQALVVTLALPAQGRVIEARPGAPYLGMVIDLDPALMREVLADMTDPPSPAAEALGVFVETLSPEALDCVTRIARLAGRPRDVPVLWPGLQRELLYRLLEGPNGGAICKLALGEARVQRIAQAIAQMHRSLTRPLSVPEMAATAGMSQSAFHQHFRALTAMSPLQYHKQLRLIEARRLLQSQAMAVTGVAFAVGYESPSQFSRDYARLFGDPPRTELRRVLQSA